MSELTIKRPAPVTAESAGATPQADSNIEKLTEQVNSATAEVMQHAKPGETLEQVIERADPKLAQKLIGLATSLDHEIRSRDRLRNQWEGEAHTKNGVTNTKADQELVDQVYATEFNLLSGRIQRANRGMTFAEAREEARRQLAERGPAELMPRYARVAGRMIEKHDL